MLLLTVHSMTSDHYSTAYAITQVFFLQSLYDNAKMNLYFDFRDMGQAAAECGSLAYHAGSFDHFWMRYRYAV